MSESVRILVVDDDPRLLRATSRLLTKAGYEVTEAETGTQGLRLARAQKPDLILLDVILPDVDGLEVCRRIKGEPDLAGCFVAMLSGVKTSSNDRADGLEAGADGYIARPTSNRELLAWVAAMLRIKRAEERLRESEERLRQVVENMPVMMDALDENDRIIVWNRECERVTGYSAAEIVEHPHPMETLYPDPEYLEQVTAEATSLGFDFRDQEWTLICKDGTQRTISWSNISARCPIPGWHTWAIGVDVTERAQAQQALKEYSQRLEEIIEEHTAALRQSEQQARAQYKGIPIPTYTWQKVGEDLVLADYNDAAEAITQGKIADLVGMKLAEMYPDTPEIREEIERCFAEQTTIEREMPYRFRSTGESKHLAVKYAFVPPDLVRVHTEDITERVRAAEQAQQRTAELRNIVNLMAGREVRMAELKDVIRKLRAQLEAAGLQPVADDPLLGSGGQ